MEPSQFEKREELQRVLRSKHFSKSPKKARFIEFVCEQSLQGNAGKLKEYLIGVEVYERGTDFDPQQDAIVRVQAHEIRNALVKYYETDGKDDRIRIDLPAGSYVPVFSRVKGLTDAKPAITPSHDDASPSVSAAPAPPSEAGRSLRFYRSVTVLLLIICAVLAALLARQPWSAPALPAPPTLPESMSWFWQPFLPPAAPPLIVIPVHPLLRATHDGDSGATRKRAFLIPKEQLPEFRDTIHFRELEGFYFVPSFTDFTAVGETLGLQNFFDLFNSVGQKVRLKAGRLVDYEEVKRANTILLGGNQLWSGRILAYAEGFSFYRSTIINKNPRSGERAVYKPEFDPLTNNLMHDYALILMLPNERSGERILLAYGIFTQGSQAAIEYITSPDRLTELRKVLIEQSPDHKTVPRYFQVLIETTVENSVPGKSSLVSTRIIQQ